MSDTPLPREGGESAPLLLTRKRRPAPSPPAARGPRPVSARLGAAGLFVAALLVLLSIFAEFVASDLPIACKLHGRLFLLPNVTRPLELASMDRGVLAAEADWILQPLVAHGPRLGPSEEATPLLPPGLTHGHPLGTDRHGRDVLARTVHGTRSYLVFALAAVLASVALGALFGAAAGLFGGATDAVVSRVVESVSAFPPLVLVIGVQAALPRPTLFTLFLAIALTRWPEVARLVRGEVMLAATHDYVLAARALGATPLRVLRRHIMPNVRGPLVVTAAVGVSAVVLTEASLDFLRVGVPAGAASWGETMSELRDAPGAWWLLAFPGAMLVLTIVACNLIGEALRSALDPRAR